MHKKLVSELDSLAHDILKNRNKQDIFILKEKAAELYEKISLLAYIEEYIKTTPQSIETKESLIAKVTKAEESRVIVKKPSISNEKEKSIAKPEAIQPKVELPRKENNTIKTPEADKKLIEKPKAIQSKVELPKKENNNLIKTETNKESVKKPLENEFAKEQKSTAIELKIEPKLPESKIQPPKEVPKSLFQKEPETKVFETEKTPTLEDELQGTLPVDVMADLFTKVEPKKSINEKFQGVIKIGLNDRIAFVTHLFQGDQNAFNNTINTLNTIENEKKARNYITESVKPKFYWEGKEEYEERFLEIIERKFN